MRQNFIIALISCLLITPVHAQSLPPCGERASYVNKPWVDSKQFCLELLLDDPIDDEMAFTALTTAPDSTLYAARPLAGQVLAIDDTDDDSLPDSPRIIAENLTLPNGLEFYDGRLYIAGAANVYVYDPDTEKIAILIADIPTGAGFWTGDITIGADERIYVATGSDDADDPARGALLSYALDGTDRQIIASGLREPVGVAFQADALWMVDSDTLKQVTSDGELISALTFPDGSRPAMLAPYTLAALPSLTDNLLIVLRGTPNQIDVPGFALVAVQLDSLDYSVLIPEESDTAQKQGFTLKEMSYRMSGFWPHHPFGVAVSPEGWVYVSIGGGRIYALRPLE